MLVEYDTIRDTTYCAQKLGVSLRRVQVFCAEGRLGRKINRNTYIVSDEELREFLKIERTSGSRKANNGSKASSPRVNKTRRKHKSKTRSK